MTPLPLPSRFTLSVFPNKKTFRSCNKCKGRKVKIRGATLIDSTKGIRLNVHDSTRFPITVKVTVSSYPGSRIGLPLTGPFITRTHTGLPPTPALLAVPRETTPPAHRALMMVHCITRKKICQAKIFTTKNFPETGRREMGISETKKSPYLSIRGHFPGDRYGIRTHTLCAENAAS